MKKTFIAVLTACIILTSGPAYSGNLNTCIKANVVIHNMTTVRTGSGVHIKIENYSYILTCNHLMKKETDELFIIVKKELFPLILIKKNKMFDLALYSFSQDLAETMDYSEISNREPMVGDETTVIGNTWGIIVGDASEGEIMFYYKYKLLMSNFTRPGCSGGGIYVDYKLIGILTHGVKKLVDGKIIFYSKGPNLYALRLFLR